MQTNLGLRRGYVHTKGLRVEACLYKSQQYQRKSISETEKGEAPFLPRPKDIHFHRS